MELTLSQISATLCADLIGEDRHFSQISINSRTLNNGDLFVAIKGNNFDAHNYVRQAEENGACGLLVQQCCNSNLPQIIVDDTRVALGDIASLWSSAFSLPIIAITGSCGKTTVKEMTAAILGHGYQQKNNEGYEHILSTKGNLNNDIGVPLTLLRLNKDHEAAVIELGANHGGEIKQLVDIVQPDVAVITNATHAHTEGFGSIEGVAKAKAEIYSAIETKGTAVINADDAFASYWRDICEQENTLHDKQLNILTFGINNQADVSATYTVMHDGLELMMNTPIGNQTLFIKQFGQHTVYNALAATAAAISSNCTLDDVKKGLENFAHVSGRMEQKQGMNGSILFDDTYNANPGSVTAGIEAVKEAALQYQNPWIILVLGDMGELGDESEQLHYQLGIDAKKMGIKQLLTVGCLSKKIGEGFNSQTDTVKKDQEPVQQAQHFSQKITLIQELKTMIEQQEQQKKQKIILLIKGSRAMAMETVVSAISLNLTDDSITKGVQ